MNWYVGTDWSVLPAGGNSLRQVFVRLEDYERLEGEVDALYATKLGQVMIERDALAADLAEARKLLAVSVLASRFDEIVAELAKEAKWRQLMQAGRPFRELKIQAARIRELESMMRGQTFQTPDEKDARIRYLEGALRVIADGTICPDLFPDDTDENVIAAKTAMVTAIAALEHSESEPSIEPIKGGQLCHLCNAVHDLMSACPPKETKVKQGEENG